MAKLSPLFNDSTLDDDGDLAVGWKINTYLAGSSTPATTYTSQAAATPQANPIVLNARGEPASPIWLTEGVSYKFVVTDENDVVKRTIDNIDGVNDASLTIDQWKTAPAPTYVSATSFTLVGDQTSEFHVGRALKLTDSSGTNFTHIASSAYTSLTTVTIEDSVLDSGLSAVSLGVVTATNTSLPKVIPGGTVTDALTLNGHLVFPATQNPSSDANTLDDYEEGTWTPALTFVTPGNLSVTYSVRMGTYVKIGRMVHLTVDIQTSAFTHTTASGLLNITGLPFAVQTLSNYTSRGALFWGGITKANYTNMVLAAAQATSTLLVSASGSGQSATSIDAADMPTGGTVTLRGQITYLTDN